LVQATRLHIGAVIKELKDGKKDRSFGKKQRSYREALSLWSLSNICI